MTAQRVVRMGLGDAVRRLLELETKFRNGVLVGESWEERDRILQALNRIPLDLDTGFPPDPSPSVPTPVPSIEPPCGSAPQGILPEGGRDLDPRAHEDPDPPAKPRSPGGFLSQWWGSIL